MLQARPITTAKPDKDTDRQRSLSLRPGDSRLRELREIVGGRLIPELEAEGRKLGEEPLERLDDARLAEAIEQRLAALERWKKIYWDVFIPFAHGVRRLATYYNDFVRPEDPYEFVGLLQDQPLLAAERNHALENLAAQVAGNDMLGDRLRGVLEGAGLETTWSWVSEQLVDVAGGKRFLRDFEDLNRRFFDIAYDRTRLHEAPGPLLHAVLELSRADHPGQSSRVRPRTLAELEEGLWDAVGEERLEEAREILAIGRLSWKLRDDDNLLVARIESQLLRAIDLGVRRLRKAGKVSGDSPGGIEDVPIVTLALRNPASDPMKLTARREATGSKRPLGTSAEMPRQLIGQPASPGLASGTVRVVRGRGDLGRFRQGEVLVCDAIQPTMTHLAMLAAAIIERRGGMLIHGAIIAREFGIPCVNGVRDAAALLRDGDAVTVDGYLGIVTVGAPELDLELGDHEG
jgi:pyruvate,water dikinase